MYCRVAVNFPIKGEGLTYEVPDLLGLTVGDIVDVPLGRRTEVGCVLELIQDFRSDFKTKPVIKLRDDYPRLDSKSLELFQWSANYYHYSLGKHIVDCLPITKKKPRPIVPIKGAGLPHEITATKDQENIISSISKLGQSFSKHLIHGVTGSGKTIIFLELIKEVIERGFSALYLLPEINLTPQFVETFSQYLKCDVYTFHSEITDSQKYNIWRHASEDKTPCLYLGVRSAVYLPINNLGIVIVDEEHDNSFKQDDRCTYNARDVSIKKAQINNCPVVLGSATPAMEIFHHFKSDAKNTFYWPLEKRVTNASLPEIILLDTKIKSDESQNIWPIHTDALKVLKDGLEKNEQSLVFINRLGFANYVQCRSCGHQFQCKNCSITLRYFKQKNQLSCQHCEYHEPMPQGCPQCGSLTLLQKGFGTEKVQEVLRRELPNARIDRFDRDEIKTFKELQKKLSDFHSGEIDILVGTQMLSKGHNFKRVKKVIILGVDNQLNLPDFRATEKIYQTIVQVAGRAGRYSHDGKVYVQTANPEASLFQIICNQSFNGFYESEMNMRQLCECPPFYKIIAIYFSSKDQSKLIGFMTNQVEKVLKGLQKQHFTQVQVLGPRPALLEKRANQFTWTLLLKAKDINQLHNLINSFEINLPIISGVSLKIDVDPQHIS
jgi:primosomal protein N' (replication factor Y) (superfamily II helicase)